MKSIVINNCFGGFSLSEAGVIRYAELKGLKVYQEPSKQFFSILPPTYWLVPPDQRVKELEGDWYSHTLEARAAYNKAHSEQVLYDRDIPRDDTALVQVVEEMGQEAAGRCAHLKVVEIPDGFAWEIAEYDGNEHVAQVHETWS